MTQRSSVTIKVSNSNESGLDLKLSSNMISNSNDETNFLYELLVTDRQVANLRKTFANNLLTNIKLSKLQISKIIQSCGFFGRLLGPLMKIGTPLMKNVLQALAKSVLIALGNNNSGRHSIRRKSQENYWFGTSFGFKHFSCKFIRKHFSR